MSVYVTYLKMISHTSLYCYYFHSSSISLLYSVNKQLLSRGLLLLFLIFLQSLIVSCVCIMFALKCVTCVVSLQLSCLALLCHLK